MIIVSSLQHAESAFKEHAPGFVVSILDEDEPAPPLFDRFASENHLQLIGDSARTCEGGAQNARCAKLIALAERWRAHAKPRPPILIHCHEGAARSMAVAYILMCAIEENSDEAALATRLRDAAPHADPNLMLVSEADALLQRGDKMIEAVLDMKPCCASVEKPVVTLPVAA